MKYRWTFHLVGNTKVSIDAEKCPPLDSEWLTLSDPAKPNVATTLHMRNVVQITKEPVEGRGG